MLLFTEPWQISLTRRIILCCLNLKYVQIITSTLSYLFSRNHFSCFVLIDLKSFCYPAGHPKFVPVMPFDFSNVITFLKPLLCHQRKDVFNLVFACRQIQARFTLLVQLLFECVSFSFLHTPYIMTWQTSVLVQIILNLFDLLRLLRGIQ